MQLFVSGKHLDVGESLRAHVAEALAAVVERHFGSAIEGKALFAHEGHGFRADVHVHVARALVVQSHAVASDPYVAFDAALERLETRLKRYRGRFESRHRAREELAGAEADSYVLAEAPLDDAPGAAGGAAGDEAADQTGSKPAIVAEAKTVLLSLSVGDAVAHMDLAEQAFYLFVNRTHGGLNVVYRRTDGAIGWIDPGPGTSGRPDSQRG
jgi:ribosomal subunit interface protein